MKMPFSLALLACIVLAAPLHAQTAGSIKVEKPFSRATPASAKVGGGYLTITNTGTAEDKLVAASSVASGSVEIHEMATKDGVMTMRPLTNGLAIPGGKSVALAPGGYHLMLMNLKAPLKAGDKVPVTLTFEKAGKLDVMLDVQAMGGASQGGHSGHKM